MNPTDLTTADDGQTALVARERLEAERLIVGYTDPHSGLFVRGRGFAYYCAGAGSPVVLCRSLEDWDDAVGRRPLRSGGAS